jgi:XTP/dITP diphosphohydrolase
MILLATRSAGKLRELEPMFSAAGLDTVDLVTFGIAESREEDALEVFDTFEDNALAKARYFARRSGLPTVADDSGLEVLALGGRPGVRSKRYSGRPDLTGHDLDAANNAKLQRELAPHADRRAKFVCAAALVQPDGTELVRRGETAGSMLIEPRGRAGFGYDPYFASAELSGKTFAEASVDEKETVSHRGRAVRALLEAWFAVDPAGSAR